MIELIFYFATEIILVRVRGIKVTFANSSFGAVETTIDGLKLSRPGVIKEYPDLKEDGEWNIKAIQRFKEKIASFQTEDEIADYIVEDLKKYGYIPKWKQKQGFRRVSLS